MRPSSLMLLRPVRRKSAGFTLIEVMIVVVIVAVLLMIGLPSYENSMQKGRRSDAREALMSVANRQEQFMLDRSAYTKDLQLLGFECTGCSAGDPIVSGEGHYEIDTDDTTCVASDTTCYELVATPVAGDPQEKDSGCTSFTLTNKGEKSSEGSSDNCW